MQDFKRFGSVDDVAIRAVDAREVAESALRMAAAELRLIARVEREYEEVLPVAANPTRLVQVLLNLLVNAAQAIPEGNRGENVVRVVVRSGAEGTVALEVHDTGTGMSEAVRAKIFTPFFTTKPVGIGTGLGLSIAKRLVEEMSGTIDVESVVGRGTVVRVQLPAASQASGR